MRVYPATPAARMLEAAGLLNDANGSPASGLRRRDSGPMDLTRPVFFIDPALGPEPASLVRGFIDGDPRFFPPADDACGHAPSDHNYNDNRPLMDAIVGGARGAYWDILRKLDTAAP